MTKGKRETRHQKILCRKNLSQPSEGHLWKTHSIHHTPCERLKAFPTASELCPGNSSHSNWARERNNGHLNWKEEIKGSLFSGHIIQYRQISKAHKNLLIMNSEMHQGSRCKNHLGLDAPTNNSINNSIQGISLTWEIRPVYRELQNIWWSS